MKDNISLADLLGAMAGGLGGLDDLMKPPVDLQAQFDAAVIRYSNPKLYAVGDLVFAKKGTDWKRHRGVPAVVLEVRPDAPPDYSAGPKDIIKRGIALDLRVGLYVALIGIVPIWVSATDFEPYDEAKHGFPKPAPAQAEPAREPEPATA